MGSETRPRHDLFVSYAEADRAWVEGYLLDALREAGVRVHSDAAFALGTPRLRAFEEAVTQSGRVLLVLSAAYLADESAGFVDLLAQTYGLESATWPVVPLLLEPVALPPRLAMLQALDASDPAGREDAVARLLAELGKPVPAPAALPACPYPGMRPFTDAETDLFHGREEEVADLLGRLHAQQGRERRFLAVVGPSGSGKSSIVFAGLVPALRKSTLFGAGEWTVASLRPGATPLAATTAVVGADPPVAGPTLPELVAAPPDGKVLLIVDQFEELFAVARRQSPADERPFQEAIARFAATPNCFVVLTVRADFYEDLMASPLWSLIQDHRAEVLPLGEAGLRQAIVRPAEKVGVYAEAALVERLAADAAGEPGVLPLVQQTLVLLWERLERRFLPLRAYEALVLPRSAYGGVDGTAPDRSGLTGLQVAVARHADATLAELSEPQKGIARRIFLRLVQFGEGRADTRRQRSVGDLRSVGDDPALFEATLRHLAANRLLTLSAAGHEQRSGAETTEVRVDLAHEALIGGWPWLQGLLAERREAEQARQRLEAKADEWQRLGQGRGGLLDEAEMAEAERWLASAAAIDVGHSAALPALIAASRTELAREVRRLRTRLYGAVAFAALALVAAVVAGLFFVDAGRQRDTAEAQTLARSKAEQNALAAARTAQAERDRAEAESTRAVAAAGTAETERGRADAAAHTAEAESMRAATEASRAEYQGALADAASTYAVAEAATAQAERDRADAAAGTAEAQAAAAATAQVDAQEAQATAEWQAEVSRAQALAASAPDQHELREDERGALLAAEAYRFDQASGGRVQSQVDGALRTVLSRDDSSIILRGNEGVISWATFSPDGSRLATRGRETVQLWDLSQPDTTPIILDQAHWVAFSPDGSTLATGSGDTTVRLWNVSQPKDPPVVLRGHEDVISSATFSPDGSTLATGSFDTTVRLWDLSQPKDPPVVLRGHEGLVSSVTFSPDGSTLATAGNLDSTVRLWNVNQPDTTPVILNHAYDDQVNTIAFSPDGSTLATDSGARRARLWNVNQPDTTPVVLNHDYDGQVDTVAFSPDGSTLATAGTGDTTVRLWNVNQPEDEPVILDHDDTVNLAAFSPDGSTVATAGSRDGAVRLWDLGQPEDEPVVLRGHENRIASVAFSPDGSTLATAGNRDGTARLWDLDRPKAAPVILNQESAVWAIAFSPDGSTLATGSVDTTARLWNVNQPEDEPVLLDHHESIILVAFSPDGSTLATGSDDGTAWLWDLSQLEDLSQAEDEPVVLRGHEDQIYTVAFSPDGATLVQGRDDGTAWLWDLSQPEDEAVVLRGHEDQVTSLAFSPDGATLVTGSDDGTARLWDLSQPKSTPIILDQRESITLVSFSPDGSTLATGSGDETVRLWDLSQPEDEPVVLRGHEDVVSSVAFSPDGSTLATAGSGDTTVRLWDLSQPDTTPAILTHDDAVTLVVFSSDGSTLATGSTNGTVRLWIARTDLLAEQVCAQVRRNLTLDEWHQFVGPEIPYHSTCPNLPPGDGAPGGPTSAATPAPPDSDSSGRLLPPPLNQGVFHGRTNRRLRRLCQLSAPGAG